MGIANLSGVARRQCHPKDSPFGHSAGNRNVSAVRSYELPDNGEAQSRPASASTAALVASIEAIEHMRQVFRGDSGAGVGNDDGY